MCPEAANSLEASANQLFQRGHAALPLAQQVSSLEKKVEAKIREAERIREQLASLNLRLEAVQVWLWSSNWT